MLFDDYWTQGLNDKQQQTIIDYVDNDYRIFPGIGGYKTSVYPSKFINSRKGRQALIRYGEYMAGVRRETVKDRLTKIWLIRSCFNPSDIITPDGELNLPEGATTLKALGDLAYCIESIKTTYNKLGDRQVEIKLCDRDKALQFIEKVFRIHDTDLNEDATGKKPIYEMTDAERIAEIQEYISGHKVLAIAPPPPENKNEE
jgi:hypothetical protein